MAIRATMRGPALTAPQAASARSVAQLRKTHTAILQLVARGASRLVNRDLGVYLRGWGPVDHDPGGGIFILASTITNTARHAATIEDGRKPNSRPPPVRAIFDWNERHGRMPRSGSTTLAARWSLAWATARNIGRRGLPAHRVVERSLAANQTAIGRLVDDCGHRIAEEWGGFVS